MSTTDPWASSSATSVAVSASHLPSLARHPLRRVLALLASLALLFFLPTRALAADDTPEDARTERAPQGPTPRVVLLAAPGDAPTLLTQIHRALASELRELPSELVIALDDRPDAPLAERVLVAAAAARRTASIAAIWLDVDGDDLVLWIVEPTTEETRRRRISGGIGRDTANLEAAAVITRASIDAMIHRAPELPPPPAVRAPPRPIPRPRRVRALVGYHGDLYPAADYVDRARRWQSGVALQLSYVFRSGAYVGAGGLVSGSLSLPPLFLAPGDFIDAKVHRVPLTAVAGYHRLFGRVGVEAEFGAGVEILWARSNLCGPGEGSCPPSAYAPSDPTPTRLAGGFSPRIRLLVAPIDDFFLFLGGGVDVFSDTTLRIGCDICGDDGGRGIREIFGARIARPVAQIGIVMRL
ncbi:MAG: hypothetical protein R3B09_19800 [Nannocystaceae bacterium]